MPLKSLRPTSPGNRGALRPDFSELTRRSPHKSLTKGKNNQGGRNSRGKMTVRHRGGGAKRLLRQIDFKRDKFGVPCKVETIEYAPNRSSRIALVLYDNMSKFEPFFECLSKFCPSIHILCSKKSSCFDFEICTK